MLKVALGQFAVSREWQDNARTCVEHMVAAQKSNAKLLVLPEGILARDIVDPDIVRRTAQSLDGPFVKALLEASRGSELTTMFSIHNPTADGRVRNNFITIRDGEIIGQYLKLHLYDAFDAKESDDVIPGEEIPGLIDVDGLKIGLMTCYDLRFPEMARRLADDGADVLVLTAAWVKGPLKEMHWNTLCTARALENTCYLIAVGECGERNIGASLAVDPLGVVISGAGEAPQLIFADIDPERLSYARQALPVLKNRRFARPELKSDR
ncbi:deaminated glutathione amidase [Pseudomonas syringae]|uniref:deaminated glutathione amidase n=1 Tax=Pseudomonas syringae TaxID=317 RepID=UPI0006B98193|nr:deaminated glutathione amidase [Pseudomonas syringae]MCF5032927.1 deaminated glutathione amidase [Pseudomonas syringae]POD19832.1 hydrolase [Pseudomonas syringae pv. syringae]UQB21773.1 deaminated glutathione amidase [Pseudomonas syringae pv. syringae]WHN05953.1 deaminated glutathione amidase [Pseudomonas syringae pv. syringae]